MAGAQVLLDRHVETRDGRRAREFERRPRRLDAGDDRRLPFGYPDDKIDAVVDADEQLPEKIAAMRAHATQVTVAPNGRSFALSNNIALPLTAEEHYYSSPESPATETTAAGRPTYLPD